MFKKYGRKTLLTLIFSCLFLVSSVFAGQDIKIIFNGEELKLDVAPVVQNQTTLIPLRHVFEAFGASVQWDGESQTITAEKDGIVIWLQLNNKIAKVGDKEVELLAAPIAIDGRTLVPLRFVSESFGAVTDWDPETKTITINTEAEESSTEESTEENAEEIVDEEVQEEQEVAEEAETEETEETEETVEEAEENVEEKTE